MVKPAETFRAERMFEALDMLPQSTRQIVALVRPDSENSSLIKIAHPGAPQDWHDLDESMVLGFAPLQAGQPDRDLPRLVRLFLRDDRDHPLNHLADHPGQDVAGTAEALSNLSAKSVLTAGAQYCYYDAQGRYICIPI